MRRWDMDELFLKPDKHRTAQAALPVLNPAKGHVWILHNFYCLIKGGLFLKGQMIKNNLLGCASSNSNKYDH